MPEIIDFPRRLVARTTNLRLINRTRSAQESLSGFTQVAASVAQRWALTLEFNTMKANFVPAYRAILAALEGRTNWLRVPIVDRRFTLAAPFSDALAPHSDETPLEDGGLYAMGPLYGVGATGQRGQKEIPIYFGVYGRVLDAGLYFGIGEDLYICTGIVWDEFTATIRCQPGLRRDYIGAPVTLKPTLICQLTDDAVGDHPLELGIRTSPTLDVAEVL